MSGGEDGYTYVDPDDYPDYTTEHIIENKIKYTKDPRGRLGELVELGRFDFALFLTHYRTSEVDGEGRVEGLMLADPIKEGVRSLDLLYRDGYSTEDLYMLVGAMAKDATDPYSIKVAEIYRDFIDYLEEHDPMKSDAALELPQLAQTAQQLGEIATLRTEEPIVVPGAAIKSEPGSTGDNEPAIELPEPTTELEEKVSLTGPLTEYESRLFHELTDEMLFENPEVYIAKHDLPLPVRLPRKNAGAHRAHRRRH